MALLYTNEIAVFATDYILDTVYSIINSIIFAQLDIAEW